MGGTKVRPVFVGLLCLALQATTFAHGAEERRTTTRVNDFPTSHRVDFVLQCAAAHAPANEGGARVGSARELIAKCSCAIDVIAGQVSDAEWIELQTWVDARPMAGERGAGIRENPATMGKVRRHRELMALGRRECFLPEPDAR